MSARHRAARTSTPLALDSRLHGFQQLGFRQLGENRNHLLRLRLERRRGGRRCWCWLGAERERRRGRRHRGGCWRGAEREECCDTRGRLQVMHVEQPCNRVLAQRGWHGFVWCGPHRSPPARWTGTGLARQTRSRCSPSQVPLRIQTSHPSLALWLCRAARWAAAGAVAVVLGAAEYLQAGSVLRRIRWARTVCTV